MASIGTIARLALPIDRCSVKINNDDTYTTSASVTLTLLREHGALSQVQFSNDNVNWSTPESYTTLKSWRLPTVGDGDVDGSGRIIAYDALLASKCAAGKITLTPAQFIRADVNGDGKVTSEEDAKNILKLSVGKKRETLRLKPVRMSGEFKVYAKFIDADGNESVVNDTIILDMGGK